MFLPSTKPINQWQLRIWLYCRNPSPMLLLFYPRIQLPFNLKLKKPHLFITHQPLMFLPPTVTSQVFICSSLSQLALTTVDSQLQSTSLMQTHTRSTIHTVSMEICISFSQLPAASSTPPSQSTNNLSLHDCYKQVKPRW